MKKILNAIIISITLFNCTQSSKSSDPTDTASIERLYQKRWYNAIDSLIMTNRYTYNNLNQLENDSHYDQNGQLNSEMIFEYQNNKRSKGSYYYKGALEYLYTYEYTEFDSIAKLSILDIQDSSYRTIVNEYNSDYNKVMEYHIAGDDTLPPYTYYQGIFDEEIHLDTLKYYIKGTLESYSTYEYTDAMVTKISNYNKRSTFLGHTFFEYTADKIIQRHLNYDARDQLKSYVCYDYEAY